MAQIKIYGLKANLENNKEAISLGIHRAVQSALEIPADKKFHRFIALDPADFLFPEDRSQNYLILEILMFEGRSASAKKQLIRELYENLRAEVGIQAQDLEITLIETPRENWGIRGQSGDELALGYKVEV